MKRYRFPTLFFRKLRRAHYWYVGELAHSFISVIRLGLNKPCSSVPSAVIEHFPMNFFPHKTSFFLSEYYLRVSFPALIYPGSSHCSLSKKSINVKPATSAMQLRRKPVYRETSPKRCTLLPALWKEITPGHSPAASSAVPFPTYLKNLLFF